MIIIQVFCISRTRLEAIRCPECHSKSVKKRGTIRRDIPTIPIGSKPSFFVQLSRRKKDTVMTALVSGSCVADLKILEADEGFCKRLF